MKGKILQALKNEYKHLGLSSSAFDGVAELLSKTITDEDGIAEGIKVSAVANILKSLQSEGDKLRGEVSILKRELKELKEGGKDPVQIEPSSDIDALRKDFETLKSLIGEQSNSIKRLVGERVHEDVTQKIHNILKGKDVPEEFTKQILLGRSFGEDFDIDKFTDEVVQGWESVRSGFANERFKGSRSPDNGGGETSAIKSLIAEAKETEKK